jgi:Transglycosylase
MINETFKSKKMTKKRIIILFLTPIFAVFSFHFFAAFNTGTQLSDNPPEAFELKTDAEHLTFDSATMRYLPDDFGLVAEAVVKSEDKRFHERQLPFDLRAVGRAFVETLKGNTQGASTIGQQLCRVEAPWITQPEKSEGISGKLALLTRKAVEIGFAYRAEKTRGKKYVIRDYLRRVACPGPGVEVTALRLFGKPAKDLNAQEAAAIVALLPSPSRRIANHAEWQSAAQRIDPAAIVPTSPAAGWVHPYGSLLSHGDNSHIIPELQRSVYFAAHKHLRTHSLEDISVILRIDGNDVARVESSKSGVICPWSFSQHGSIRCNSIVKLFWADLEMKSGAYSPMLARALEISDNEYFTRLAMQHGRSNLESNFASFGLVNRNDYSPLGRIWVNPSNLLDSTSRLVSQNHSLRTMLSEVPRRGTCSAALKSWPFLPRDAFCKSGTGPVNPGGSEYLIVGGRKKLNLLIFAKGKGHSEFGAGKTIGPLFADIIRITNQYSSWQHYAHSSK